MNKHFLFSMKLALLAASITGFTAGCARQGGEDTSMNEMIQSGTALDEQEVKNDEEKDDASQPTDTFYPLEQDTQFTLAEETKPIEKLEIKGTNINGTDELIYSDNEYSKALVNPTHVYIGDSWFLSPDNTLNPKVQLALKHDQAAALSATLNSDLNSSEFWKFRSSTIKKQIMVNCDFDGNTIILPDERCAFNQEVTSSLVFDKMEYVDYEHATFSITEKFTHSAAPLACNTFVKKMQALTNQELKKCGTIGFIFAKLREQNQDYDNLVYFQNMTGFARTASFKVKRK